MTSEIWWGFFFAVYVYAYSFAKFLITYGGAHSRDVLCPTNKIVLCILFSTQYTWSFLFVRYEIHLKDLQCVTVTTLKKIKTCVVTPWRLVLLKGIASFTMRMIMQRRKKRSTKHAGIYSDTLCAIATKLYVIHGMNCYTGPVLTDSVYERNTNNLYWIFMWMCLLEDLCRSKTKARSYDNA